MKLEKPAREVQTESEANEATRFRWIYPAWVALIASVLAYCASDPVVRGSSDFLSPIDRHKYLYMAEHGVDSLGIPPFCYRVLGPWVAGLFSDSQSGFIAVAIVGIALAAWASYAVGEHLTRSSIGGWSAMALFLACSEVVRANLRDFWLSDALAFGLIMTSAALALRGRLALAAVVAIVAGLGRETALLIGPLAFAWSVGERGLAKAFRTGGVLLSAALLGLAIPRLLIHDRTADAAHLSSLPSVLFHRADRQVQRKPLRETVRAVVEGRVRDFRPRQLLDYTVLPLGLVGLAFAWLRPARRLVAWGIPALAIAYGQLLVGTDTTRLVAYGAPVFVIAGAVGATWVFERSSRRWVWALWVPFLGLVTLGLLGRGGQSLIVWQGICGAFALATAVRSRRRSPPLDLAS